MTNIGTETSIHPLSSSSSGYCGTISTATIQNSWETDNSSSPTDNVFDSPEISLVSIHDQTKPPSDKFFFVAATFFLGGISSLLPWNFFSVALEYFQYKLRDKSVDERLQMEFDYHTHYMQILPTLLTLLSVTSKAVFNIIALLLMNYVTVFTRYLIGVSIVSGIFVLTIALTMFEIDQTAFFVITIISAILINGSIAFVQSSLMGYAAVLPTRNVGRFTEGQAVSGIIAASANIISLLTAGKVTTSALIYFCIALGFVLLQLGMVVVMRSRQYFLFYWEKREIFKPTRKKLAGLLQTVGAAFRDAIVPGFCVVLTYFATISVYPALTLYVMSMNYKPGDQWTDKFFVPVIVYLFFSVFDFVGRPIAVRLRYPRVDQPKLLLSLSAIRIILIPIWLFMNLPDKEKLIVLFNHDVFPAIYMIILGLTNGYLTALSFVHAPKLARPGNEEGVGIAMCIYLSIGLVLGASFSLILEAIF